MKVNRRFFLEQSGLIANIVEVILGGAGLKPNETVRITDGDRSGGSRGFKLQPFTEKRCRFMVYVDVAGNSRRQALATSQ